MKILFVCKYNVGRSQIAEAFLNKLSKKHRAVSAGIKVETNFRFKDRYKWPSKSIKFLMESMANIGYDLSSQETKQLTKEMVKKAGKIIVMCAKRILPSLLKSSPKVEYWRIQDGGGKSLKRINEIRDQIKKRVEELIKKNG